MDGYLTQLRAAACHPRSSEVSLRILIAVTGRHVNAISEDDTASKLENLSKSSSLDASARMSMLSCEKRSSSSSEEMVLDSSMEGSIDKEEHNMGITVSEGCHARAAQEKSSLQYTLGRPNLADFVQEPVEASAGETSVVVCGGKSLTSAVRNCVATLSDERAVHKGTGAQGIHLHVEEFGL